MNGKQKKNVEAENGGKPLPRTQMLNPNGEKPFRTT